MNLPPLPETDLYLAFYDEGGMQEASGSGYTADQMRSYAEAAVLAERERCAQIAAAIRAAASVGGSDE